jgi:Domain of unknown function (DUF4184)
MPCTLSHPAAVLPFRRVCPHYLDFPALVIGSMTPDFGYYIHRFDVASFAHTIPGTFVVCLPSGVFLLLIFYLVRKPVCFILPMPHREALLPLCSAVPALNLRSLAMILLSLLLGAWSHILWDSFTHQTGWFVQRVGWLREPLLTVDSSSFPGYYLLQQFSTIAGAAILLVAYRTWIHRHQPTHPVLPRAERWRYLLWAAVIVLALLLALPPAAHMARAFEGYLAFRVFVFRAGVYFLSIALSLIILASTLIYARRDRMA